MDDRGGEGKLYPPLSPSVRCGYTYISRRRVQYSSVVAPPPLLAYNIRFSLPCAWEEAPLDRVLSLRPNSTHTLAQHGGKRGVRVQQLPIFWHGIQRNIR